MSQRLIGQLSIEEIARLWAAENEKAAFGADNIGDYLVKAAAAGEFEHPTHSREDAPRGKGTYKHKQKDGTVETTDIEQHGVGPYRSALSMPYRSALSMDGHVVNAVAIQNYIKARQTAPGATDRETRRTVASEVFLSVEGLRRWCDEPGFAEWAQLRGLSRPCFIELASGDGIDQASVAVEGPEKADRPPPSPPSARRRGRRPKYDWALFHAEIARKVGKDPDGFPVVQADLENTMMDWCMATWGENNCPSESTIRDQVSQYYNDDSQGR